MRITLGKAGRRQQGGLGLREKRQRLGQPGKGWSLGAQERASGLAPVAGLVAGPGCWARLLGLVAGSGPGPGPGPGCGAGCGPGSWNCCRGSPERSSAFRLKPDQIPRTEIENSRVRIALRRGRILEARLVVGRESWQKGVCFQRPIMCVVDSGQMVRVAQPFSITRIYLFNKQRLPRN